MNKKHKQIMEEIQQWAAEAIERGKAVEEKSKLQWPDSAVEAERIRLHALGVTL